MAYKKITTSLSGKDFFRQSKPGWPKTPRQVVEYYKQHGEWPMALQSQNSIVGAVQEVINAFGSMKPEKGQQYLSSAQKTEVLQTVYEFLTVDEEKPVLNLCCGYGGLAFEIMRVNKEKVVGIDIDPDLIAIARFIKSKLPPYPESSFLVDDMAVMDTKLPGDSFQKIFCYPPETMISLALETALSLLEHGGHAVFVLPTQFWQGVQTSKTQELKRKYEWILSRPIIGYPKLDVVIAKKPEMPQAPFFTGRYCEERDERIREDYEGRLNTDRF